MSSTTDDRLIVTNGDCAAAAIVAASIPGALLAWRDVLHDGPVPAGLDAAALARVRARFIAACGWAEEAVVFDDLRRRDARLEAARTQREIVLWFEHDLYDQLQLVQILDRVARRPGRARWSLACRRAFIAEQEPATLARDFAARAPVNADQIALARRLWSAFRAPTPVDLVSEWTALRAATAPLPFLATAIERLLEEYPSPRDGMSRTERGVLEVVRAGTERVGLLFGAVGATEEARFMGDASFWRVVEQLANAPRPALALADGSTFRLPTRDESLATFREQRVRLTDFGRALLDGEADWVVANGVDRWLGGVHLKGTAVWRWQTDTQRLVTPD